MVLVSCIVNSSIKAPPGIDIGIGKSGKLIARGDPVIGDTLTLKKLLGTGQAFGSHIYMVKDFRVNTSKGGELGTSIFLKDVNCWYHVIFFPNKTFGGIGNITDIKIKDKELFVFRQGQDVQVFTVKL